MLLSEDNVQYRMKYKLNIVFLNRMIRCVGVVVVAVLCPFIYKEEENQTLSYIVYVHNIYEYNLTFVLRQNHNEC